MTLDPNRNGLDIQAQLSKLVEELEPKERGARAEFNAGRVINRFAGPF